MSRRCSSATNCCRHLLKHLHQSAPPLFSRHHPPPHPTLVNHPSPPLATDLAYVAPLSHRPTYALPLPHSRCSSTTIISWQPLSSSAVLLHLLRRLIVLVDCHFIEKVIGVFYPSTAPPLPCLRNTTKRFLSYCSPLSMAMVVSTHHSTNFNPFAQKNETNPASLSSLI